MLSLLASTPWPSALALALAGGGGPVCDPGGQIQPNGTSFYPAECNGPLATVQLDGTGSTGTGELSYFWTSCPAGSFDDPTSPTPILTLDMTGSCLEECGGIVLTVTDQNGSSSCNTAVLIQDTTPPVVTCPPDAVVGPDDPTDPAATGFATALDLCAGSVPVTWSDAVAGNVITRTWSADDGCGVGTCVQTITIEEPNEPGGGDLDMHPTSCPNPVNVKSKGLVPAAINGAADFDVSLIDRDTLMLVRNDGIGGAAFPKTNSIKISDVSTPFDGELCDCHTLGKDGFLDLKMGFHTPALVSALQLTSVPDKTTIQLDLHGSLLDGTDFVVSDCIRVQNK